MWNKIEIGMAAIIKSKLKLFFPKIALVTVNPGKNKSRKAMANKIIILISENFTYIGKIPK